MAQFGGMDISVLGPRGDDPETWVVRVGRKKMHFESLDKAVDFVLECRISERDLRAAVKGSDE